MEDPINQENYEEAKSNAKLFYSKIGKVWCPALNDHIVFNNVGFKHLIWKTGKHRFKGEQKRRFALIPDTEIILKNARTFIYREVIRNGKKTFFWTFTEKKHEKLIKVVIRQDEGKKKIFQSVFEK
jgi:hypothetical protein